VLIFTRQIIVNFGLSNVGNDVILWLVGYHMLYRTSFSNPPKKSGSWDLNLNLVYGFRSCRQWQFKFEQ